MENSDTRPAQTSAKPADFIALLRPTQWVKNIVVLAGPAAGLKLFELDSLFRAIVAFLVFCVAASASYAINDTLDREADARHPTKRYRPVARGAINPAMAMTCGIVLIFLAVAVSGLVLGRGVALVVCIYFVMTLGYSLVLKHRILIDVILISMGFVLRTLAGSLAVDVVTSKWLIACMFTLCMFLGFGKRRSELAMIGDLDEAGHHRSTLLRYTPDLLNHLITLSAGIAVITFLLYTIDTSGPVTPFPKEHLFFTLPLVVYGIFRYAMLTELSTYSGPTEIILKDKPLRITIVTWALVALAIVYQDALFGEGCLAKVFQGT